MSTSHSRDDVIKMYEADGRPVPKEVLEAEPNDVFSYGFTMSALGAGYGPLRKTGSRVDGKYTPLPKTGATKVFPFISVKPLTEQEIYDQGLAPKPS